MFGWLVLGLITLIIVLDGVKLRARLRQVRWPTQGGDGEGGGAEGGGADGGGVDGAEYKLLTVSGLSLPSAVEATARAWASAHKLKVLHLIPRQCGTEYLLAMASLTDPEQLRAQPTAVGGAPGQAVLVHPSVLDRVEPPTASDIGSFLAFERRLKPYSGRALDYLALDFAQVGHPFTGPGALKVGMPGASKGMIFGVLFTWIMVATGLFWATTPALMALVAWLAHGIIAVGGSGFRPRDLLAHSLARPFADLARVPRLMAARSDGRDPVEERRGWYEAQLAEGTERLFQAPVSQCYLCGAEALKTAFTLPDLHQGKPGQFKLDRCEACGHLFQNPQLTVEGLNLYYADFYDGLGEAQLESMFAAGFQPYAARTQMVLDAEPQPERWLDVGCGHGHFACVARDEVPSCRFEGLEISESVEEAERRGWVDRAWRGLFPELAPTLPGPYDVVSMSHYLEHTTDPRAELVAAQAVLKAGGHLFIELPDPTCVFARLLGRYWMPWFQPQHLHLLSPANLERLLEEVGFEVVQWRLKDLGAQFDLALGAYNFVQRWTPRLGVPWLPKPGPAQIFGAAIGWILTPLALFFGGLMDVLGSLVFKHPRWASTFRVIARRHPPAPPESVVD